MPTILLKSKQLPSFDQHRKLQAIVSRPEFWLRVTVWPAFGFNYKLTKNPSVFTSQPEKPFGSHCCHSCCWIIVEVILSPSTLGKSSVCPFPVANTGHTCCPCSSYLSLPRNLHSRSCFMPSTSSHTLLTQQLLQQLQLFSHSLCLCKIGYFSHHVLWMFSS